MDHVILRAISSSTDTIFTTCTGLYRKRRNKRSCFNKCPPLYPVKLTLQKGIPLKQPPSPRDKNRGRITTGMLINLSQGGRGR